MKKTKATHDITAIDLTGKTVLLYEAYMIPTHRTIKDRLFHVTGGFGTQPWSTGKCFGWYLIDKSETHVRRSNIERLATDEEIIEHGPKLG